MGSETKTEDVRDGKPGVEVGSSCRNGRNGGRGDHDGILVVSALRRPRHFRLGRCAAGDPLTADEAKAAAPRLIGDAMRRYVVRCRLCGQPHHCDAGLFHLTWTHQRQPPATGRSGQEDICATTLSPRPRPPSSAPARSGSRSPAVSRASRSAPSSSNRSAEPPARRSAQRAPAVGAAAVSITVRSRRCAASSSGKRHISAMAASLAGIGSQA